MNVEKESKIWSSDELQKNIRRNQNYMQEAAKVGVSIKNDDIKGVYPEMIAAINTFEDGDEVSAGEHLIKARLELTNACHEFKELGYLKRIKLSYYHLKIHGFFTILPSVILMPLFFCLIYFNFEKFPDIIEISSKVSVPLWALWLAGIGSTLQILIGISRDLKEWGIVHTYKRMWYWLLPIISLGFGFVAYLIVICGLWTFGTDIANVKNPDLLPMLICFLAGYATDWFMGKLEKLTKSL